MYKDKYMYLLIADNKVILLLFIPNTLCVAGDNIFVFVCFCTPYNLKSTWPIFTEISISIVDKYRRVLEIKRNLLKNIWIQKLNKADRD